MSRVRPARKCTARRTNGKNCRAWAIVGGEVCVAHGGAAPQVRHAAYVAYTEERLRRQFERAWARLERETFEWQVKRVAFAAVTLDIPVEQVDEASIWWAYSSAGRKPEPRPKIRCDRRFKMPKPPARKPRPSTEGEAR